MMKFGIITRWGGIRLNDGYTLEEVENLAKEADECECDLYDLTGDLAVAPQLLRDLVNRIKELELRVSKNS